MTITKACLYFLYLIVLLYITKMLLIGWGLYNYIRFHEENTHRRKFSIALYSDIIYELCIYIFFLSALIVVSCMAKKSSNDYWGFLSCRSNYITPSDKVNVCGLHKSHENFSSSKLRNVARMQSTMACPQGEWEVRLLFISSNVYKVAMDDSEEICLNCNSQWLDVHMCHYQYNMLVAVWPAILHDWSLQGLCWVD